MAIPLTRFDFRYGESLDFHVLPARDLDAAQPVAGLYAWFFRLRKTNYSRNNLDTYSSVFSQKKLKVSISGHLEEAYGGRLKRQKLNLLPNGDPDRDAMLLASAIFSPPIYIGISVDLRNRLMAHRRYLESALQTSRPKAICKMRAAVDSDDESGKFGERIGFWLRAGSIRNSAGLFVKLIYLPGQPQSELRKIETYYNRIFTPMFGRR